MQPHNFTDANHVDKSQHMNLEQHMMRNKEFAIEHDIPIVNKYSVAPHHSGTLALGAIFILRKEIGVGGWSRKWQFSLYVVKMYLHGWVGGSKKPQNTLT